MIDFACGNCAEPLSVPDSQAGEIEKCPACGTACPVPWPHRQADPFSPDGSEPNDGRGAFDVRRSQRRNYGGLRVVGMVVAIFGGLNLLAAVVLLVVPGWSAVGFGGLVCGALVLAAGLAARALADIASNRPR